MPASKIRPRYTTRSAQIFIDNTSHEATKPFSAPNKQDCLYMDGDQDSTRNAFQPACLTVSHPRAFYFRATRWREGPLWFVAKSASKRFAEVDVSPGRRVSQTALQKEPAVSSSIIRTKQ